MTWRVDAGDRTWTGEDPADFFVLVVQLLVEAWDLPGVVFTHERWELDGVQLLDLDVEGPDDPVDDDQHPWWDLCDRIEEELQHHGAKLDAGGPGESFGPGIIAQTWTVELPPVEAPSTEDARLNGRPASSGGEPSHRRPQADQPQKPRATGGPV